MSAPNHPLGAGLASTFEAGSNTPRARASAIDDVVLVSHGYEVIYERGFCNGVAAAGARVTLLSSDRTDTAGLLREVATINLRGSQDQRRGRWRKAVNLLGYHLRLIGFVLKRRPVVHVFGLIHPPVLCGLIEGAIFRLASRRYLVTAHNLLPHDAHTAHNRLVYGIAYRLADRVVVHTERMKDDLQRIHRVEPSRIVVMEHGIEPLAGDLPGTPAPQEGPLRILFFGKVLRYKGIDVLLEALRDFPLPFTLMIAGNCTDAVLRDELRAQMAGHRQAAALSWRCEHIPDGDVPGLFLASDVLALPYRHIDQSGVLFQSLRYGVPVVASRVGSFERYVGSDIGETCAPDDAAQLLEALLRVAARRGELGRAQIRAAGRRYEWPQTAAALLGAYALKD